MINISDAYAHLAALSLENLGRTAPNPNVSAVIYSSDGQLISEGAHNPALSTDHAEVVAIKKAGAATRGATIVVSLEPCNHTGKTGPCVDAIIAAGISKVIYAVKDPNPIAAGGADRFRSAGVEVEYMENAELADIQGAWLHRITTGRPFFIWKVAVTLDGRIAAADGSSQWITSEAARADVQVLRSQSDAILSKVSELAQEKANIVEQRLRTIVPVESDETRAHPVMRLPVVPLKTTDDKQIAKSILRVALGIDDRLI